MKRVDDAGAKVRCWRYRTPDGLDDILMASDDGESLTGLWFEGSRDAVDCGCDGATCDLPAFRETCRWLDIYFGGRQPDFTPPYRLMGSSPFRDEVVREMLTIPFGATATYGDIAAAMSRRRGGAKVSAQAVGGAVGWNPICIIIPCHRVIGAGGKLVGYGGGISNKVALLSHEGHVAGFVCRRCGACCRIKDGIVRVSDAEISRIAAFLGMGDQEFIESETELSPDRKSLILKSRPDGACAYLTDGNLCRINPVKPRKCRTFPHEWTNPDSAEVCPGIAAAEGNKGAERGW